MARRFKEAVVDIVVAGSAGSAVGSGTWFSRGIVKYIAIEYTTQPGTTTVQAFAVLGNSATDFALTESIVGNTDLVRRPAVRKTDDAGAATASYEDWPVGNIIRFDVAVGDPGAVQITILYEEVAQVTS